MYSVGVWLNILASTIIDNHFRNFRCLIVLTDHTSSFNYLGSIAKIKLKISDDGTLHYDLAFQYHGCQGIVIWSEKPERIFSDFEKEMRIRMERLNERRYLILSTQEKPNFFGQDALNFVADLLLIVPNNGLIQLNPTLSGKHKLIKIDDFEHIVIELWTHKYVGTDDNDGPVLVDRWFPENCSFQWNSILYPDKIAEQKGRALRMATITYKPYSIPGNSTEELYGSEMKVAVNYALRHNMTPTLVVKEDEYWGEIYPNGSGNGILGSLVRDDADVGFGSMDSWDYAYIHLDLTNPVVRTAVTGLVPAPQLASGWLTPFLSYSPEMWLWFGFGFLVSVVAVSLTSIHHYSVTRTERDFSLTRELIMIVAGAVMKIYKPLIQQALMDDEITDELSTKMLTVLMLMFSLFFYTTYSSGLASILTLPRYDNMINTVQQLAESDMHWGATDTAWIDIIRQAKEPDYHKIVQNFEAIPEEKLRAHALAGSFGFAMERLPFKNFAVGWYVERGVIQNYRVMQEDIYWANVVMWTRKSSVLLPTLNDFILRAFEGGIINIWQNEAVFLCMDPYVQRVVNFYTHSSDQQEVVKLKWTHVEGAFAALILGHLFSFLVFLGTIFHLMKDTEHRSRQKPKERLIISPLVETSTPELPLSLICTAFNENGVDNH